MRLQVTPMTLRRMGDVVISGLVLVVVAIILGFCLYIATNCGFEPCGWKL